MDKALRIVRDVCGEIAKNSAMKVPAIRRRRLKRTRSGVAYSGGDDQLERYAFQSLRMLRSIAGDLYGKSILEIGPGDYLTSGMSLLAAGALRYSSIDRFVGDYQGTDAQNWYIGIQEAWPRLFPEISWPTWLSAVDFPRAYPNRITIRDAAIEDAGSPGEFDIVCSFQVGEHVSDIERFARLTADALHPSGIAVHRIDFGPHDCWLSYSDPFTFLRFPDALWRAMGSARGTPNRFRFHDMRLAFQDAGLFVEVSGIEATDKTPEHSLARRFRDTPLESLQVQAAIFVCRHESEGHRAGREGRASLVDS